MMRTQLAARGTLLVLLGVVCGCGPTTTVTPVTPGRHYEAEGGFSYDPPAGWEVVDFPGFKYRISHGSAPFGFAPNINVVNERFTGTLDQYVDANLNAIKQVFPDAKILSREPFQPTTGAPGCRVIAENEQQGRRLRQSFFFFEKGDRKYVATCSTVADGGEMLDDLFASSMKTFRLH